MADPMNPMHILSVNKVLLTGMALVLTACGGADANSDVKVPDALPAGEVVTVRDTVIEAVLAASAVAEPVLQATLSTKLMGTVIAVRVREGDRVTTGQALLEIDARDLAAKDSQVRAGIAGASAMHTEALAQASRIRALYADGAATKAQLDAVEAGLTRADAALTQARAGAAELDAMRSYAVVRAPFSGIVTSRFVDPGAFAAPGAPLIAVQDGSRLRLSATVAPEATRGLRRGARIAATIEGRAASATVEGVIPASSGNLYTINAMVANPTGDFLPGSAATLLLPQGSRAALLVPVAALRREGDLTGVLVRGASGDALRWLRLGPARSDDWIEVIAGLEAGEQIVVPTSAIDVPHDGAGN